MCCRGSPSRSRRFLKVEGWKVEETSSRFILIFGMLFAFQSNSEVMQPATCFHNHIPKFGTTETDDVVNNPIPLDIADNMFDTDANG